MSDEKKTVVKIEPVKFADAPESTQRCFNDLLVMLEAYDPNTLSVCMMNLLGQLAKRFDCFDKFQIGFNHVMSTCKGANDG